jgi:ketosteroid isomerase-like protein
MSEENVETLRAVYGEWARGNFNAGSDLFARDTVFETFVLSSTVLLGPAEMASYLRELFTEFEDYRMEAREFAGTEDTVVVTEHHSAHGKLSGVETEMTLFAVWTFRDGLVSHVRWGPDRPKSPSRLRE